MSLQKILLVIVPLGLLAAPAAAQPLQLNVTVRSFTSVPGSPWVADIWTYTDPLGRDFALVCRGNQGMSIYEITNPSNPVFASSIAATGSDLKDVKTYQHYAYCVQQGGPTLVVDLSNPYAATTVYSFGGCGHNGTIDEGAGLFIQTRNGCSPYDARIYSLANPAAPVYLSSYGQGGGFQTHDAYAADGYMYVSVIFGPAGTDIVDISNPSNPQFVHKVPSGGLSHSCWIYTAPGGEKILCSANETSGGHVRFYDVTNPPNTPLLSEYQTSTGASISVHNPLAVGRYCYIAYYADYLRVLDMANPADPREVAVYDPAPTNAGAGTFDGAWGVAYVKDLGNNTHRVVLTESFNVPYGFWVIDVHPGPVLDLSLSTSGNGDLSMAVAGADPSSLLYNPVSLDTSQPFGTGPVAGLQPDAIFTLAVPPGTQPFIVTTSGAGTYSFNLPPLSIPSGISADITTIGPIGTVYRLGPVGRIVF